MRDTTGFSAISTKNLTSTIDPLASILPLPCDLGDEGAVPERTVAPVSQILIAAVIFFSAGGFKLSLLLFV